MPAIRWTSGKVFGMTKQSRPGLPASAIRFLRRVLALMTERVPLEAMDKVRVRDVLGRQELQELRAVDRASDHARQ